MDLYYNNQKVGGLPVDPITTIGQVKTILSDWLVPQGVANYTVRLVFNNGSELSSVVFTNDTYDAMNFQDQASLLPGGAIYVNTVPVPAPVPEPVPVSQPVPVPSPKPIAAALPTAAPSPRPMTVSTTHEGLIKLKIPELKEILRARKLKLTGKKQELIDRILGETVLKPEPTVGIVVPTPTVSTPAVPTPTVPTPAVPTPTVPTPDVPAVPEAIIYAIKDGDDYTGFKSKEAALRWWLNKHPLLELEIIGLYEPIDFDDEDEQDLIIQAMEDDDYSLVDIIMGE